ncbi:hypothetical protein [Tabrizicola oligotrophica]|uniref:Uncharacterized protein n=1 Tax=Tabrizicola oligotrophica TaxID=2710650 RepID=A0A6M0QV62_9RHOB|nr:hypothetical protein [Tabrizicola oligotrophica]NEY90362.1 hypothetical protein [Tabrizicola oligotrophica]
MTEPQYPPSPFRITYEGSTALIWRRMDNVLIAKCNKHYLPVIVRALAEALRGYHREGQG